MPARTAGRHTMGMRRPTQAMLHGGNGMHNGEMMTGPVFHGNAAMQPHFGQRGTHGFGQPGGGMPPGMV